MCDNVVDIYEHKPHLVSEVVCLKCLKRWIAVRPEDTWLKELQCPKCKQVGFVINTGQEIVGDEYADGT